MKYYGYTKEQLDRMVKAFNMIEVKGLDQIDAFHEATTILRHPVEIIGETKEGAKQDGQSV